MNKIFKTILIISIVIFGNCFLLINFAQAKNILVEILDKETSIFKPLAGNPVFDGINFLPEDTITERIKVTNYTPESQTVGLKVKNFDKGCIDSYCLSDKLYLTVGELGNGFLYSGSLTDFYKAGEIPLSGVSASEGNVQYDFSVHFDKDTTAKEYQGSTTDFDLEIGFFTKETVSGEPFAGGGGYIPPIPGVVTTITISGPTSLTSSSATISWGTDIPSYCRVIYDEDSHPVLGDPPNYGYTSSTEPPATKTTSHEITLTNLESGTTYYYRVVCWASPKKISKEFAFTTKAVAGEGAGAEEGTSATETPGPSPSPATSPSPTPLTGEPGPIVSLPTGPVGEGLEGMVKGATTEEVFPEEIPEEAKKEAAKSVKKFLASIASLAGIGNPCRFSFWLILAIAILLYLFLRKKKDEEPKEMKWKLIFPAVIIVLILLYRFFCCWRCRTFLIEIIVSLLLTVSLFLKKRKKEEKPGPTLPTFPPGGQP